VQVSSSRALGATPPQTLSGAYVLEVGPAQATSNGATQEESINLGSGGTFTSDLLFGNDGSVALTRITQTGGGEYPQPPLSPGPPIVVVPAALSAGQAWSGSFTSPVGNGSYTGSLQGPTSTAVGGRTLSVWTVTIHVSVAGTYDGYPYTATVDVRAGWSPDLRLFVSDHMDTHGQLNTLAGLPLFAVQGTLDATLLSATPS
jgi:hypothetical protein